MVLSKDSFNSSMEDISFSIYRNQEIQKITLQDLAKNKRVLICSVVRTLMHVTDLYIKELISQIPYYKANGVDDVYIIASVGGTFGLVRFEKVFPEILALLDEDTKFVSWIKESVNKTTPDLDLLSKYWSYQVLLNNGEIEQFYEQPTENYIRHLIKAGHKPNLTYQKFFITEGDAVGLHRPTLTKEEQNYLIMDSNRCSPLEFMYFNLCPNTKLNQYLLDTAKQTSI
jgi:peroxiredoxin